MSEPAPRPTLSIDAAKQLLARRFGLDGATVVELPSYIDRNYEVEAGGRRYVLKVANAATSRAQLELEGAAMDALGAAALGFATPAVIEPEGSTDGLFELRSDHGQVHLGRLVSFVPGILLADAGRPSDTLLRSIGAGLADADLALAVVRHPARVRALRWDLAQAGWLADELAVVHDPRIPPARQAWVEGALLQFRAKVAPALAALPRTVIHNDANDYNLTVDAAGTRLAGLFDFGDMLESCRIFEPVIAATYAAFHRPDDPFVAIAELVAGYDEALTAATGEGLGADELELVPELVATRLACSLVSSAEAAAADPSNSYAGISEQGAWRLLEQLHARSRVEVCDRVVEACGRRRPARGRGGAELLAARRRVLGPNLSVAYADSAPLEIVRGRAQYLFDAEGRAYLDCVNNVCHVGHCHPRVVAAACEQIAALNTNTRYLHPKLVDYAAALVATLPAHLEVAYLVCSGSEANELALRLARTATGRADVAVLDHAYHGNTGGLVALSPYKFDGPGGAGVGPGVHVLDAPDPYRQGACRDGRAFAEASVGARLAALDEQGSEGVAALLAESLLGCGGQIVPPPAYLARAFELAREHGALAIADEVQVGFGRVGPAMWGFAAQDARPDIVTLGKPIGNGHPIGAVVTTRAIAEAFANGMEYFNTFGGNPVSCAIGLAVLDVLADEDLAAAAAETGAKLQAGFRALQAKLPIIGDVRGLGLFIGVELVEPGPQRAPAAAAAKVVTEACRREGILLSVDGPGHNVLKIKPPLVFDAVDGELLVSAVERALRGI